MKALSIQQPFATLLASGEKRYETRSWRTNMRGEVAIHASKGFGDDMRMLARRSGFADLLERHGFYGDKYPAAGLDGLPLGAIIGVATIVGCHRTEDVVSGFGEYSTDDEKATALMQLRLGDFRPYRFAFEIAEPVMFDPIPCAGQLNFWNVPEDIEALIEERRAS